MLIGITDVQVWSPLLFLAGFISLLYLLSRFPKTLAVIVAIVVLFGLLNWYYNWLVIDINDFGFIYQPIRWMVTINDLKGVRPEPFYPAFALVITFSADDVRDGLLPVEHSPLDTSKLGSKRVLVWSVDSLKNRTQFEVILNVIDVNPPIISQSKEFLVEKDSTFLIEDFFTFEDEQKDHLDIEIRNSYDLSKVGSYPIVIAASDPSGNTNTYDTVLVVYEEASEELDGYYYIQDADIRDDRYTLVNRRYQLPNNFTPDNLVLFPDNYRIGNASATLETVAAFC